MAQLVILSISILLLMFGLPLGLVLLGHSDIGEG